MLENKVIVEGQVKSELKEENGVYSFNFSFPSGEEYLLGGEQRMIYTYIRVVFVGKNPEKLKKNLRVGKLVRLEGKLDSEKYITQNNKKVFNKVLAVDTVISLRYDEDLERYEEEQFLC